MSETPRRGLKSRQHVKPSAGWKSWWQMREGEPQRLLTSPQSRGAPFLLISADYWLGRDYENARVREGFVRKRFGESGTGGWHLLRIQVLDFYQDQAHPIQQHPLQQMWKKKQNSPLDTIYNSWSLYLTGESDVRYLGARCCVNVIFPAEEMEATLMKLNRELIWLSNDKD